MGKLQNQRFRSPKAAKRRPAKAGQGDVIVVRGTPNPSKEQIARSEALGRYLKDKLRELANMTPAEKAQADRDWQKLKKSVNEGRYRKVILD